MTRIGAERQPRGGVGGGVGGGERGTCVLGGRGVDDLCMGAISEPGSKKNLRNATFEDGKVLAEQAIAQPTKDELMTLGNKFSEEKTSC